MEREFEDIDRSENWSSVFNEIKEQSRDYPYKVAKRQDNRFRNRYRDVSPYDHSRVKLQRGDNDYINASLMPVPAAQRSYILTQGPLPNTCGHFWQMVWEQGSRAVVMLNRVVEKGSVGPQTAIITTALVTTVAALDTTITFAAAFTIAAVKCAQYWPSRGEREMSFPDVELKLTLIGEDVKSYYTVRELQLENLATGEARVVLHFHYTAWPDFGVPESPASFLRFLRCVRESGTMAPAIGPAVVHCSAGIGRSGTFCLVDTCLLLMDRSKDPASVELRSVLLEMRRSRMGLIQTPDQLRFSYLAVIQGAAILSSDAGKRDRRQEPSNDDAGGGGDGGDCRDGGGDGDHWTANRLLPDLSPPPRPERRPAPDPTTTSSSSTSSSTSSPSPPPSPPPRPPPRSAAPVEEVVGEVDVEEVVEEAEVVVEEEEVVEQVVEEVDAGWRSPGGDGEDDAARNSSSAAAAAPAEWVLRKRESRAARRAAMLGRLEEMRRKQEAAERGGGRAPHAGGGGPVPWWHRWQAWQPVVVGAFLLGALSLGLYAGYRAYV